MAEEPGPWIPKAEEQGPDPQMIDPEPAPTPTAEVVTQPAPPMNFVLIGPPEDVPVASGPRTLEPGEDAAIRANRALAAMLKQPDPHPEHWEPPREGHSAP